jgi:acetyltransferase EpsM
VAVQPVRNGVLILGAGGHGKVVADTLISQGIPVQGFLDDAPNTWGKYVIGIPVLGAVDQWPEYQPDGLVLGIGANATRQMIVNRLGRAGEELFRNAFHSHAIISSHASLGYDVVVIAGAVINASTIIGNHVIVNTCSSIDHDCVIGDYAHIAPGCHLAGGVSIGEGAMIGAGAVVIPGCTVGKWAVIGAGAVVVRNIPDHVTAKGVPARWSHND